jgi:ABC-2 type transport system permease protein
VSETVAHSWFMLGRQWRNLRREPIWIALMLIQPMFWLVLYSQLFQRLPSLPGFDDSRSYIDFFTPGVVVMTAFFSGTWSGMSTITDLDRHVIERFLATPVHRSALIFSQMARAAIQAAIQGVIILVVALPLGATSGGPVGWLAILAAACLVATGFAGISHGIALLTRKDATMIAISNFIGLPLLFVSATLIDYDAMPEWMQWAARANPVQWAVDAGREPSLPGTDWTLAAVSLALLVSFTAATSAFATWSFRAYQRTL